MWFAALAFDWALLVGYLYLAGLAIDHGWWLALVPLVLLIGSRQHALAVLAHDGSHRSITANPRLNDWWAWACFLPLGGSLWAFRRFHSAHHAYLGTEKDPERANLHDPRYRYAWEVKRFWPQMARLFAGESAVWVWRFLRTVGPTSLRESVPNVLFLVAAVSALWATGLLWVLPVWVASLLTAFWVCFHLRIFTEHHHADAEPGMTWAIHMPWWGRWLTHPHNVWLHDAHHDSPSTPFYRLPAGRVREPMSMVEFVAALRSKS